MEKNNSFLRKGKPHNARPYDRPNQSIFGKVASKVKSLLNQTWFFNAPESEGTETPCAAISNEEIQETQDPDHQVELRSSKKPRLVGNPAEKISAQPWLQPGTSRNLYHPVAPPTLSNISTNQMDAEQPVINGDDRSDNSEGSASTSGCSSLVSSHKDRLNSCLRLSEKTLQNLSGDLKAKSIFQRTKDVTSYTGRMDRSKNTSLWSCGTPNVQSPTRSPSVMQSTKPSFNFAAFSGPSKVNTPSRKTVSSPFYEGKTTFGGASSCRRMPLSVAPYQTEKSLRNKVNVKENTSINNSECMSSAAKRILQTLEKMSTPISDAKKMPNTNHSPVDLSIYLTPPSHRKNTYLASSKQTPKVPNKGPPIANINTITKLTTMKNVGLKRHRMSSEIPFVERRTTLSEKDDGNFSSNTSFQFLSQDQNLNKAGGGGGKMKSNLNQRSHFTFKENTDSEFTEDIILPDIRLPITPVTGLPTIRLGLNVQHLSKDTTTEKEKLPLSNDSLFTFANPIIEEEVQTPLTPVSAKSNFGYEFSSPVHVEAELSKVDVTKDVSKRKNEGSSSELYSGSVNDFLMNLAEEDNTVLKAGVKKSVQKRSGDYISSESAKKTPSQQTNESLSVESERIARINSNKPITVVNSENGEQIEVYTELESPITTSVALTEDRSADHEKSVSVESKQEPSICAISLPSQNILSSPRIQEGFGEKFKPQSGSWECPACMIRNQGKDHKCVACTTPNPASQISTERISCNDAALMDIGSKSKGLVEPNKSVIPNNFKVASSKSWECDTCLVRNPLDKDKCIACETLRPSKENTSIKGSPAFNFSSPAMNSPMAFKFGSTPTTQQSSNFSFGIPSSTTFPASSNKNSTVETNQTLTVTSSGFKIDSAGSTQAASFGSFVLNPNSTNAVSEKNDDLTNQKNQASNVSSSGFKIEPQSSTQTANFGGFALNPNPTDAVTEKKDDLQSSVGFPKRDNFTFSKEASHDDTKSELNFISKSETTDLKIDTSVSSVVPSSSESSNAPGLFSMTSRNNLFKIGSDESKDDINKQFQFSAPSSQDTLKISGGFSFDGGKMKSTDNGITSTTSSPFLFGTFTAKDSNSSFPALPKLASQQKTVNESAKENLPGADKNNFKFVAPLPVSSPKQIATPIFGSTSKPETNIFSFGNSSQVSKATEAVSKATSTFTSVSGFSTVNSVPTFKFSDTSSKGTFGSVTTVTPASSAPGFSFFPTSTSISSNKPSAGLFTFGATSSSTDQPKPGGFTFKGLSENKQNHPLTSNTLNYQTVGASATNPASVAVSSAPSLFKFGASSTTPSTAGFSFGNPKSEPQPSAATPFVFGSSSAPSGSNTTFPAFQQVQPAAAPNFQFGSGPAANPTQGFGTQSGFAFGAKSNESANQMTATLPQNPPPAFGCPPMQPVFGGAAAPAAIFGKNTEAKPQNAGFNFTSAATQPSVFRFGAPQEKTAPLGTSATPGFAFGAATAETPNNFPSGGFNMSTPSSFNFGAASSSPAGPFQFAASSNENSAPSSAAAPRKYRKAVRRAPK